MSLEQKEIGALDPLVGYHLRRASGAFSADFAVAMDGTGMRQVLVGILAIIAGSPDINQGTVGKVLGIKRANMVSLINELSDGGLIDRKTDPGDRRALVLNITPAGQSVLKDCLARIAAHEQRMLAGFSDEEKTRLLELLGRIERREPAA